MSCKKLFKQIILDELAIHPAFELLDPKTERYPSTLQNFRRILPLVDIMSRIRNPNWGQQQENIQLCIFCWKFIKIDKYLSTNAFFLQGSDILCFQSLKDIFGNEAQSEEVRYLKYINFLNIIKRLEKTSFNSINDIEKVIDTYLPKYGAMPSMNHVCLSTVSKTYKDPKKKNQFKGQNEMSPEEYEPASKDSLIAIRDLRELKSIFSKLEINLIEFRHLGRDFYLKISEKAVVLGKREPGISSSVTNDTRIRYNGNGSEKSSEDEYLKKRSLPSGSWKDDTEGCSHYNSGVLKYERTENCSAPQESVESGMKLELPDNFPAQVSPSIGQSKLKSLNIDDSLDFLFQTYQTRDKNILQAVDLKDTRIKEMRTVEVVDIEDDFVKVKEETN